jgi:hypothetical protein
LKNKTSENKNGNTSITIRPCSEMTCDSMLLLGSPFVDIYPRCDASSLLTSADIPDPPPSH